ncbi:unnamed protein product [Chironomus riparius]|uniref:UBX domain-containing protein n=1 Tax=Chironomus riparius TaxID=315576 RepID=A0A9N9RUD9_9DIPT|nr:unnamed protein product [Chironomus riparius]
MDSAINKEEILANFQQITAMDIAGSIHLLESTGWDLEAAIHLSLDGGHESDTKVLNHNFPEAPPPEIIAGTSRETYLNFNVRFKNSLFRLNLSDQKTIGDLKQNIMKRTSVPVCRQNIRGLLNFTMNDLQNDSIVLRSLNLPVENNVELNDLSNEGFPVDMPLLSPLNSELSYQLRIYYTNEDRHLNLNFPATKTLIDIKNDLNAVLKIPVRFQKWEGWPTNVSNATKLNEMGIEPIHSLKLTCTSNEGSSSRISIDNAPVEIHDSDSDSVEEFEDAHADDDIFTETVHHNRLKLLIEDKIEDEILGSLQFVNNYKERYGNGPSFFEGSLEDAMKTAYTSKSAKDRKLLAVYLHHDNSVLSNVFCGQLLGNDNIIKLLNENYILFGWDLTCESNKNMFLSSLTACVADSASLQIRNLPINQFPIIIIIRKYRSICEVADIIHGNINGDELYIHLMMNSDAFNEQMKVEIREENERAAREVLLNEQKQAYQESLLADMAKEEEKLRIEKMIETERQKQEYERMQVEAKKEAERKNAENSLPPEPLHGDAQKITKIRFRKPTGEFIERKFTVDTQLKILFNYATANGFSPTEFKIISSFPRRDLTLLDPNDTLKKLNLVPQETLILEER